MGRPEMSYKCGCCETAIFNNQIHRNGKTVDIKKAVFQKRYKDHDGEWKSTGSLDVNDIPKAILALSQSYAYLMSGSEKSQEDAVSTIEAEREKIERR